MEEYCVIPTDKTDIETASKLIIKILWIDKHKSMILLEILRKVKDY